MTDARTTRHPRAHCAAYLTAALLLSSCAAQDDAPPRREQTRDDSESTAESEPEEDASTEEDSISKAGPSTEEEVEDSPDGGVESCVEVTARAFEVFAGRCAGCHGNGKSQGGFGGVLSASLMISSGRVVPREPASSPVFKRVQSGDMPRGASPLDAASVAAIEAWIECGAPSRPGGDTPPAGEGGVLQPGDGGKDAGAADAGIADAGERDRDTDEAKRDRDEEAEEAQKDLDEEAEEAQKDLDEEAEEAQRDRDEAAEEAAEAEGRRRR